MTGQSSTHQYFAFSGNSDLDGILASHYEKLIEKKLIQRDLSQILILNNLQKLLNHIVEQDTFDKKSLFYRLLFSKEHCAIRSVYIFGDVGRGKSMLMDMFYQACPIESKRRVHFHVFMQEVHQYMHQWRETHDGDPIPALARHVRKNALLLCFDEFHVSDIADAMLLSRLFTRLINLGVVFVSTSNQHPDDLYPDGLQRELFLPFIALLKRSVDILELRSKEDYRLSYFKAMKTTYHLQKPGVDDGFLQQRFDELSNAGGYQEKCLMVTGRTLCFSRVYEDILFTSFDELCGRALGPPDYQVVAMEFSTVLLANIPRLSREISDFAKRFVILIDLLYENNVKLVCTAHVPVEQLYLTDFDFERTQSRLIEMQSEQYFHRRHRA